MHAADELLTLEQVDEAVIGELRHEHLRHVLQRGADLEEPASRSPTRSSRAILSCWQRAVPLARLARQDHHPVDVAAAMAQRHGQGPDQGA